MLCDTILCAVLLYYAMVYYAVLLYYVMLRNTMLYSKTPQTGTWENEKVQTDVWKNTPKDKNQKQTDVFQCSYEVLQHIRLNTKFSNFQFQDIGKLLNIHYFEY